MYKRKNKGMILFSVLGVILILAVFVFSYFMMVRNATQITKQIMSSEVAYHLAQSGLSAGVAWFENTRNVCPLKEKLLNSSIYDINSCDVSLPVSDHGPLQKIITDAGADAGLEVTLELSGFKPAYSFDKSASGICYSEREKTGVLIVRAIGSFDGVQRVLVASKQVRVLCTIPYVISKFTLFVNDFSSESNPESENFVNCLRLNKENFKLALRDNSFAQFGTLTLNNGSDTNIENRGWVFVGSPKARYLNLAFGRGVDGEEHHLLKKPWTLSGGDALNNGFVSKFIQKGIFTGIKEEDNKIFEHYDFDSPSTDPLTDKASLLRLFGTVNSPSATITIGTLYRRFMMLRYLKKLSTNKHTVMPFCGSQAIFDSQDVSLFPNADFDVKADAFTSDYFRYVGFMSTIYSEPYNVSADYIMNPDYSGITPPSAFEDLGKLEDIDDNKDFLYSPEHNYGHVRILTDDNTPIFEGNLDKLASKDLYFEERATCSFAVTDFPSFLAFKPEKIPGVINFTGGAVIIDKSLNLKSGGIICIDGDITINKAIPAVTSGVPLSLVSLNGNIIINTDGVINASLVALNGTLKKKSGMAVNICGNLVIKSLDPVELLSGGGDIKITYDDKLDPTTETDRFYDSCLSPKRFRCRE